MRMLLKLTIPAAKGNQAIADGTVQRIVQNTLATLKPEAAYFFPSEGKRGGFIVFDLADPSQIPAITEPLFHALDAEITLTPVMSGEDLAKGLSQIGQGGSGQAS